ncbi:hypothetical protein DAEQUDRAFT_729779 [Daedalea quercina L-15889]|uniref:CSC1/OSCA1-like 7TM region domain-containing protein n=1 Tax=Daedalea quercina L-15889 TaxID=1314783 RepID=A0A165NCP4_9APHY|nr:hypothetical protein DAEQUDRAFT_729779 [Daedalea quercina L-15889]
MSTLVIEIVHFTLLALPNVGALIVFYAQIYAFLPECTSSRQLRTSRVRRQGMLPIWHV